jgi:hypothetical protein
MRAAFNSSPKRWFLVFATVAALGLVGAQFTGKPVSAANAGPSFVEFESGQVRPLALCH